MVEPLSRHPPVTSFPHTNDPQGGTMNNRTATALTATAVTGMLLLTACGDPAKASGLFDEVKFKSAVTEKSHIERVKKTKRVCTGTGAKRRCSDVPDGFKNEKVIDRRAKPALYCVELDDVNGKPDDDDRWFEVSASTYRKWADASAGVKVTDMEYSVKGCMQ